YSWHGEDLVCWLGPDERLAAVVPAVNDTLAAALTRTVWPGLRWAWSNRACQAVSPEMGKAAARRRRRVRRDRRRDRRTHSPAAQGAVEQDRGALGRGHGVEPDQDPHAARLTGGDPVGGGGRGSRPAAGPPGRVGQWLGQPRAHVALPPGPCRAEQVKA